MFSGCSRLSVLPGCIMLSAVFASSPVAPDLFGLSVVSDRLALFRSFALCFQDFFGCRKSRFYLIPSRQSARRMKRLTAAGSVSQQRDCRRHRREAVETMRPEGRMTAVITAAMSVAAQCSVIRWLPSPARVKRSRGGAGAVSAGVWPGPLVAWGFSEFSGRAGSGGVALPFSRSAGSGVGVSPASEAVADASVADGASVVAAVGVADAAVADGVAAVSAVADGVAVVAACVVAAIGVADASGVFVIVSTVVFADCGGISPLSGSMRRMRWRIWRPSQRNSTTSPGCRA